MLLLQLDHFSSKVFMEHMACVGGPTFRTQRYKKCPYSGSLPWGGRVPCSLGSVLLRRYFRICFSKRSDYYTHCILKT